MSPPRFLNSSALGNTPGRCRYCDAEIPAILPNGKKNRRRSWCSDKCLSEYAERAIPMVARTRVTKRDKGVCALCGLDTSTIPTAPNFAGNLGRLVAYHTHLTLADLEPGGWVYKLEWESMNETEREMVLRSVLFEGRQRSVGRMNTGAMLAKWEGKCREWVERKNKRMEGFVAEVRRLAAEGHPATALGYLRDQHLWEMDHILPVVEGGGACGLDNLRTLCRDCHKRVTAELRVRLKGRKDE